MTAETLARLLGGDWAIARDTGSDNLARRLALGLRHLIANGLIPDGTRLPAERTMALAFHVSRPTVTAALDELRATGLVESRQGSGTWISARQDGPNPAPAMAELVLTGYGINLGAATPPDAALVGGLTITLGDLLSTIPAHGYDLQGLAELRHLLAARSTAHGLPTNDDEIIVTSGAHHALAVAIGTLVQPGDRVIVEYHTYGGFLDLLEVAHARPIAVARDGEGALPDELEDAIRRAKPRVVYLMPSVHAPTGATTTDRRRRELASVLDRHRAVVIADEALTDLRPGNRPPSLASLCSAATVLTVESLSKSIWGGLRVGWIRAPHGYRELLLGHRARVDLGTAIPSQHAAISVVTRMDRILEERNADLRKKATQLQSQLEDAVPEWSTPTPDGGLCLWVDTATTDSSGFVEAARREGVIVMPGTVARADRGSDPNIRICFDRNPTILTEAGERLARVWKSYSKSRR